MSTTMSTRNTWQCAIDALRREADRVGWPLAYREDLEYDAETLRRHRPSQFGWILRISGTHLLRPEQSAGWTDAVIRTIQRHFRKEHVRWYWWNGVRLEAITPEEMRLRLDRLRAAQEAA